MKRELITATAVNKHFCPLPNCCQTKKIHNLSSQQDVKTLLDINKNVSWAHIKQHLKIVSGIIERCSTALNIKLIQKRTGIINTSRHRSKYKLANFEKHQIYTVRYYYNSSFQTIMSYFANLFRCRLIS